MGGSNWAGNHKYAADRVLRPNSVAELRELVVDTPRVKPLGTRHSFNDIADFPDGSQIDVSGIDCPLEINADASTVTVGAAMRYGDLAGPLDAAGYALANLASLPHCTVAGSVATATHGSGQHNQNLSAAVVGLEMVTADGELRTYSRHADPDVFPGLVVALGALGVVTRVTLDVVPSYQVAQCVFDHLPWDAAFDCFDEIQDAAYSVSLFTNWADDTVDQVWLKNIVADGRPADLRADFYGAPAATGPRHPVRAAGMSAANCTEQMGVPGPWYDRIPHFRLGFTPSAGDELQSEFFVPRRDAVAALRAIREIADLVAPLLFVSEIRTIAGDDLWLSPCHGEDRVALHFTWQPRQAEVEAVLPVIEERLAPFGARPHWGKLFHGGGWVAARYPRLHDFRALVGELDPNGRFRSPFVQRQVFGGPDDD
ncbi:MAG TPA: FAD-binding protein [Pseudonocardiaceae bacterium]